jgi:hypothetical protein
MAAVEGVPVVPIPPPRMDSSSVTRGALLAGKIGGSGAKRHLRGIERLAAVVAVAALALAACTSGSSSTPAPSSPLAAPPPIGLTGQVLDAGTQLPLAGVTVSVGAQSITTGADGNFSLTNLTTGGTVSFENCAYSTFTLAVPLQTATQDVQFQPLAVSATVTSNLTHKGIAAHFEGKVTADANKKGVVSLSGLCPGDELSISAKGYADATVGIDESGAFKLSLEADPATTFTQEVAWEAAQKWKLDCALIHPDALAYTSVASCIKADADAAIQGYQAVSIKIHSVTYITWTFPKCAFADFGPKTYHHVAALNYTEQQSTPGGGVAPVTGVAHFVQTKNGLWRWFPLTTNCP